MIVSLNAKNYLNVQSASDAIASPGAELKKQGKEKKPDANLVGTPFPEP